VRWNLACFLRALRCGLSSDGCIDSIVQIPMPVLLEVQFIRLQKSLRIKTVANRCALVAALVSSREVASQATPAVHLLTA